MILVTVGSQLPFDRLARAVDEWCAATGRTDVFGQLGEPGPNGYRPKNYAWSPFLSPTELDAKLRGAQLIIAHAGMGSIISALRCAKPIVIMPRRASLGEHRNEHQMATASRFAGRSGIYVADDETALPATLQRAFDAQALAVTLSPFADRTFTASLRQFIFNGTADVGDVPEKALS